MERTQELTVAHRQLEELALTDALTNLPNRRHAMTRLSTLWDECIPNHRPLSSMMIDADGFKQNNDRFGHDAGNLVLRELSGALRNSIRTDDFLHDWEEMNFLSFAQRLNRMLR